MNCRTLVLAALALAIGQTDAGAAQVCYSDSSCEEIEPEPPSRPQVRSTPSNATSSTRATARTIRTNAAASHPRRPPTQPVATVTHKVAIQVNERSKLAMELALDSAKGLVAYYKAKGEATTIEIVAYGPGLHMLRGDTSPVKDRVGSMSREHKNVSFIACGNTQAKQSKAEGNPVVLVAEAKVVPSGVVRLMELQKQGYAYLRP